MKKSDIFVMYNLIGGNIKFAALHDEKARKEIMDLFRSLRRAVGPIEDELKITETAAAQGSIEEMRNKILEEEYKGEELQKVSEDTIVSALAESGCNLPLLVVINAFKEVII